MMIRFATCFLSDYFFWKKNILTMCSQPNFNMANVSSALESRYTRIHRGGAITITKAKSGLKISKMGFKSVIIAVVRP